MEIELQWVLKDKLDVDRSRAYIKEVLEIEWKFHITGKYIV